MKLSNSRQSNFELLRLISMFFIVMHHYTIHGVFQNNQFFTYQKLVLDMLASFGKISVNIFVLIGSYFLLDKKFELKRISKLLISMFFYSYLFLLLAVILKLSILKSINVLTLSILPFPKRYWFITTYILLLCIFPWLNILIDNMKRKEFKTLLIFLGCIWCLFPGFLSVDLGYSNFGFFVFIYLLVGYRKKFLNRFGFFKSKKQLIIVLILSILFMELSVVLLNILGIWNPVILKYSLYFTNLNGIFPLLISLSVFELFGHIEIYSKTINLISKSTLGVYLIHENIIVKHYLWKFINNSQYTNVFNAVFMSIVWSFTVFIICIGVDFICSKLINRIYFLFEKLK